jgi:hypothetical protein
VPVIEIEHHSIGRRLRPVMLAANVGGADHAKVLTRCVSVLTGSRPYRR